jgi:hypothetical protein
VLPLKFWKRDVPKDVFSCRTRPFELPTQAKIDLMFQGVDVAHNKSESCRGVL